MDKRFVIQSDSDGLRRAEGYVELVCDEYHLLNQFGFISVAVMHAVQNAIDHGNKGDASKWVTIECGLCKGGVFFQVSDQGVGFDFAKFGGLPSEGEGEGIFVMKTIADCVEYQQGGRCVKMTFFVDGIDDGIVMRRQEVLKANKVSSSVEI